MLVDSLKNVLNELKDVLEEKENYFDGFYRLFEFQSKNFEKVYFSIEKNLGKRNQFNEQLLETSWDLHSPNEGKLSLKLYQEHLEVFFNIPSDLSELQKLKENLDEDVSEPQKLEYLYKRKEAQIKLQTDLKKKSEESFLRHMEELNNLKSKRINFELELELDRRGEVEAQIKKLKQIKEEEEDKINDLILIKEKNRKLKEEKLIVNELKSKREDLEIQQNIEKVNAAYGKPPVGFDFDTKNYESKLIGLRMKYGEDVEIDNMIKTWSQRNASMKRSEFRRQYAKQYVEYYLVKYEGLSIMNSENIPKRYSGGLNRYKEEENNNEIQFMIFITIFVIIVFLLAALFE